VEHGAYINKENRNGEIVLFIACKSGNKDLVEYLVEHGADLNKIYYFDKPGLYYKNNFFHFSFHYLLLI
jgi:ankyrin repeat protein